MYNFSDQTFKTLTKHGWFPSRNLQDLKEISDALEENGYRVLKSGLAFYSSFGGIEMYVPHSVVPGNTKRVSFDIKEEIKGFFAVWVTEHYEKMSDSPLTIIGASNEYFQLLINEQNQIYAGFDDMFCLVGNSVEEAMEVLCTGKPFINLTEDE
jgi:SUKH-3 immunity protein